MRLIDRFVRSSGKSLSWDGYRSQMSQLFTTWQDGTEKTPVDFQDYVRRAYQSNGVVFGLVLTRATLLSETEFRFRNLSDRRVFGSPALLPLERPWRGGSTGELIFRMEQDVSLAGNAYIRRIYPDPADGPRLQRLRPDWVKIVTDGTQVIGYIYEPPGGKQEFLPWNEVAHWSPIPDPESNFRGMSWITPVAREVLADSQMTDHRLKFFQNAATPNLLIKYDGKLDPQVKKELKAELALRYEGVTNAYRSILLEGGADATIIGANLREMDFALTQAAGENRLAVAAGVPAIIAGLKEGLQAATYSNYAQAMRRFADLWGRPQWRSLCEALETIIDVPAGARLWYSDDIPALRTDRREQADIDARHAQAIRTYVDAGFEPKSVIAAITSGDLNLLEHTGKLSVQLQPVDLNDEPKDKDDDELPPLDEGGDDDTSESTE